MTDIKKKINDLILEIERGNIDPKEAWRKIRELKNVYTKQYSEQSWHVYIGNKFQNIIYSTLKGYFNRLKRQDRKFENLSVLTQNEVEKNEIIHRKLAVKYGEYLLLPDADIVVVDYNFEDPWKSVILAIISCKTSLRERIAQSCYWKLKLLSSDITKNIRVFLATTDNDEDFPLRTDRGKYGGKHRNRIIAEYELDGVYILREDFKEEWESDKVKRYERIFNDLVEIFRNARKNCF